MSIATGPASPAPAGAALRPSLSPEVNQWLQRSDLLLAGLYLAIFFIFDLQTIRFGYDHLHQSTLLLSSLRIFDGQVPFRDFFPWYGPLYHYSTALIVRVLGGDMLAVKLFLRVFSPVVSMAMLLAAARWFRIDWRGRCFVVFLAAAWGLVLLFHCGSIRNIIGLFFLAGWAKGVGGGRSDLVRSLAFPAAGLLIIYSPDTGLYVLFSMAPLAVIDLLRQRERRLRGLAAYAGGGLIAFGLISAIERGTVWGGNYFAFCSYTSENMMWALGQPLPELNDFLAKPGLLLYLLPVTAGGVALAATAISFLRGRLRQLPLVVPACGLFAVFSWNSTYIRTDMPHLLFALPPAAILLGLVFSARTRWNWSRMVLLTLAALSVPAVYPFNYIAYTDRFSSYGKSFFNPTLGIYQTWGERMIESINRKFVETNPHKKIIFFPNPLEAYLAGLPIEGPCDDLIYTGMPIRQQLLLQWIKNKNPDLICIDTSEMIGVYTAEDLDKLFDFFSANYYLSAAVGQLRYFGRREQPVKISEPVKNFPAETLTAENSFHVEWKTAPSPEKRYLEFYTRFHYRPKFGRRFSLPQAYVFFDGVKREDRHRGRNSMVTRPEGGWFRLFIPPNAGRIDLRIGFPGILNYRPDRVELTKIRLHRFLFEPQVPYTMYFLDQGY